MLSSSRRVLWEISEDAGGRRRVVYSEAKGVAKSNHTGVPFCGLESGSFCLFLPARAFLAETYVVHLYHDAFFDWQWVVQVWRV